MDRSASATSCCCRDGAGCRVGSCGRSGGVGRDGAACRDGSGWRDIYISPSHLRTFRNVTAGAPSILAGSPISAGPSVADQLLLCVRACVCSGSSLFGSSPIRTRPLLTHRGISIGCRESSCLRHISSFLRLQPDLCGGFPAFRHLI